MVAVPPGKKSSPTEREGRWTRAWPLAQPRYRVLVRQFDDRSVAVLISAGLRTELVIRGGSRIRAAQRTALVAHTRRYLGAEQAYGDVVTGMHRGQCTTANQGDLTRMLSSQRGQLDSTTATRTSSRADSRSTVVLGFAPTSGEPSRSGSSDLADVRKTFREGDHPLTRSRALSFSTVAVGDADPVTTVFIIGAKVLASGRRLGELTRVVVDPNARAVTHLVVEPQRPPGTGHLVPVELVVSASEDEITLRCTATDFSTFDMAREVHFIRGGEGPYQSSRALSLAAVGAGAGRLHPEAIGSGPHPIITERIPSGDVDLRRGESAHATDGAIGLILGLVVDPTDHSITHVLLHEGHLRGEKRVAIPIAAVIGVESGVRLSLSRDDVEHLPAITSKVVTA